MCRKSLLPLPFFSPPPPSFPSPPPAQPDPVQGGLEEWLQWECDPDVKAVLVGFDHHFSYMKMMKAATYILKRDCVFLGTNWDASLPVKEGNPIVIPGLCVAKATERK